MRLADNARSAALKALVVSAALAMPAVTATATASATATATETATATATAASGQRDAWRVTDFPVRFGGLSTIATDGGKAVTVGFGIAAGFRFTPLAAEWDGSAWSRQPVRLHGVSSDTQLVDVDLTSATSGWAVGRGYDGVSSIAVTARWNGKAWTGVPVDDVPGDIGFLGVTALGSKDVWAVGQEQIQSRLAPVIGHYDGKSWTDVKVPRLEHVGPLTPLTSIAEGNDGTLWAVGLGGVSLRYDGHGWRQVSVPQVGGAYVDLQRVRWLGPDGLWAVGYAIGDDGRHPVALHWDGAEWQPVQVPAGDVAQLDDVASTDKFVVSVGYGDAGFYGLRLDESGASRPLGLPPGQSALFGAASSDDGARLWVVGSGPVGDKGKIAPYAAVR